LGDAAVGVPHGGDASHPVVAVAGDAGVRVGDRGDAADAVVGGLDGSQDDVATAVRDLFGDD
jgi:hypothetical protein